MQRHHPLLVVLHWLMAVAIITTLLSGGFAPLDFHLASGLLIGALLLLRFAVKLKTDNSQLVIRVGSFVARTAQGMHLFLYVLMFGAVASGLAVVLEADLFQVLTGKASLPAGFSESPFYSLHAAITDLLLAALALHALAALWHQFIKRDQLFSRMWFPKRQRF